MKKTFLFGAILLGVFWIFATAFDFFQLGGEGYYGHLGLIAYLPLGLIVALIFGGLVAILNPVNRSKNGIITFFLTLLTMIIGIFGILPIVKQLKVGSESAEMPRYIEGIDESGNVIKYRVDE